MGVQSSRNRLYAILALVAIVAIGIGVAFYHSSTTLPDGAQTALDTFLQQRLGNNCWSPPGLSGDCNNYTGTVEGGSTYAVASAEKASNITDPYLNEVWCVTLNPWIVEYDAFLGSAFNVTIKGLVVERQGLLWSVFDSWQGQFLTFGCNNWAS